MALSSDLISQLVKVNKQPKKATETTVYGTTKVTYEGETYVKLDGSDILTPIRTTTSNIKDGDRVTVLIKDHSATVTGNMSDPSASGLVVEAHGKQIDEFEVIMAYKVVAEDISAINATIDNLIAKIASIGKLEAVEADIETLRANLIDVDHLTATDIEAINAQFENLEATFGTFTDISTEDLEAINADIGYLKAYTADFTYVSAEVLDAVKASIKELDANKLSAETAEITYANIDFANIGEAAIRKLFSDSGLIRDLVVGDGTITGELVGVTIKGDLIEGNTVKADKLVVKGTDGIYYKLNIEGGTFTGGEAVPDDSLHGSVITAKSITAEKVSVKDLVAFGATIGGFTIKDHSLYSGVKESASNTTRGIFLGDDGQVAFGDGTNFFKYYYDDTEQVYRLAISAGSLTLSASGKNVENFLSDLEEASDYSDKQISEAQTIIQQLANSIAMLVTDENGGSMMTQTENGWTFNISHITKSLGEATDSIDGLTKTMGGIENTVNGLNQALNDVGVLTDYVIITTYEGQPCIELGETDNDFKLRITNTAIQFVDGSSIPAYINNQKLMIEHAEVKNELQFGGFVWKKRSNGNMGIIWKGVNS